MKKCSTTSEELDQSHGDPKGAILAASPITYLIHKLLKFLFFFSINLGTPLTTEHLKSLGNCPKYL